MESQDEYSLLSQKKEEYNIKMSRNTIIFLSAAIIGGLIIITLFIVLLMQK